MRGDFDEDEFPDDFDFDDDDDFDCHMDRSGQCGKAGTEECDWDCPVMAARRKTERPGERNRP